MEPRLRLKRSPPEAVLESGQNHNETNSLNVGIPSCFVTISSRAITPLSFCLFIFCLCKRGQDHPLTFNQYVSYFDNFKLSGLFK